MSNHSTAVAAERSASERSASLALLERIVAATEANTQAIHELAEAIQTLLSEQQARVAATPSVVTATPASFVGTQLVEFQAESIVLTIAEDGQPAYKIKGFPFVKFGVRVWPEVLPQLGVDPDALKPGANPFSAAVRAVLNEDGKPKKVVGLAA